MLVLISPLGYAWANTPALLSVCYTTILNTSKLPRLKCGHSEAILLVLKHVDVATVCLNMTLFHQLEGEMFVFTGLSVILYSQLAHIKYLIHSSYCYFC